MVNLENRPDYARVAREKRLSTLSPLVFEAAFTHGDPLALSVLRAVATGLADQIALMVRTTDTQDIRRPRAAKPEDAILCFGGSLVGIQAYRSLVLEILAERGIVFKYVEWVADVAAVGAVSLATAAKAASAA
jgi:predicted NBD/HSP70 family sugar kinase